MQGATRRLPPSPRASRRPSSPEPRHPPSALGLASGEKLTVKSVIADPDGATHVRYERTLDGLRVIGGDFVSHKDASGAVKSVTLERAQERHPADDDADRLQEPGAPGRSRRRQGQQGDRHPG